MAINNVLKFSEYQSGSTTNPIYVNSSDSYATITTADWLQAQIDAGLVVNAGDIVFVSGQGSFQPSIATDGTVTLYRPVGSIIVRNIAMTAAALATAGHVAIQPSAGSMQFQVNDIKVNYSSSGLSGGGGDRLVKVTDGTTIYNNAGITAALLGTPVNTVWGGSGNPLPGTVALNTATAAGAALYAAYSGGATDFTTGTVNITVTLTRVA